MSRRGRTAEAPAELVRARTVATPPYWLAAAAVLVTLPFLGKVPTFGDSPPWAQLLSPSLEPGVVLRAAAGLPWVLLLALSVAGLATRTCRHSHIAAAVWVASPIVVLGLHDTWTVGLPAAALATFAMAAYSEGLVAEHRGWFIASGAALGLAVQTQYSMAALVPVLVVHMLRQGRRTWLWAAMFAVFAGVEGVLWGVDVLRGVDGQSRAWTAWTNRADLEAGVLAAGTVPGRALGTLVRGALLALPLVLLRSDPRLLAGGLVLALLAVVGAWPSEMPVGMSVMLLGLAGLGGALLARASVGVFRSTLKRRKGDRGDPLLLGGWVLATVLGVVFLQDHASPLALLPAAAPLALLLTRSGEEVPWGKNLLRISAVLSSWVALFLAVADYRTAGAGVEVAGKVLQATTALAPAGGEGAPVGRFAGERSFRGAMESAGWIRYRPDEVLPAGTWVVVAKSFSGPVHVDLLDHQGHVGSIDTFPLRVIDHTAGVSLHTETLAPLPFGRGRGPLEGAELYRSR